MIDTKDTIIANQAAASDPSKNVWVNASAGSGKTKVLIDRILRLLLDGAEPRTILCITFTQAAALEMQQRLQRRLEGWVAISEDALASELNLLDPNLKATPHLISTSRKLFNQILDQPVQIQTIHSFAQKIVMAGSEDRTPFFGARLMDDINTRQLVQSALNEVFETEQGTRELNHTYALFSQAKFKEITQKILDEQAFFRFLLADGIGTFRQRLVNYLYQPRSKEDVRDEFHQALQAYDFSTLQNNDLSSDSDKVVINQLLNALSSKCLDDLISVLLTEKRTPKKRLLSQKMLKAFPCEAEQLYSLAQHVHMWDQELKKTALIESTLLVVKVADAFLKTYTSLKNKSGLLDYDDLIFKALELLSNPLNASNLLYKLDHSIYHILVDEAQDTNLYQWKLIDFIIDIFLQNEQHKTIFVVGDHKQAIFGFQGTNPDIFHQIKQYHQSKPSVRSWIDVSMDVSFRSLQSILDFVDSIFENQSLIEPYSKHTAFRGSGGHVVIHPANISNDDTGEEAYEQFTDQIANRIEHLLKINSHTSCLSSPLNPCDILILIRKRGEHLDRLQEVLMNRCIPFSSPNRKLIDEDALVKFILHAITLITQPYDDMLLTKLLLNPLLGLTETAIKSSLVHAQNGGSLINILKSHPLILTIQRLAVRYTSLYDLYLSINMWAVKHLPVTDHNISNGLVLLNFLQEWVWDQPSSPTYSEYLRYVQVLQLAQINRIEKNAVRILTVHGAKGLQAPVVFLIDTTQLPITRNVWVYEDAENLFLCAPNSSAETLQYQELKLMHKAKELKEYYRLLYVALTRAENELHIFGYSKPKIPEKSWYTLCSK